MGRLGTGTVRRGGVVRAGLGLAALGTGAALVGAFVVGPMLKMKSAAKQEQKTADARAGTAVAPGARESEEPPPTRSTQERPQLDETPTSTDRRAAPSRKKVEVTPAADADQAPETTGRVERPVPPASATHAEESHPGAQETRRPVTAPRESARRVSSAPSGDDDARQPRSQRTAPTATMLAPPHDRGKARPNPRARDAAVESDNSSTPDGSVGPLYRVRAGRFATRAAADEVRASLAAGGIPSSVVRHGSGYTIQAGCYRIKENADRVAETLRQQQLTPEVMAR
jgi:cell division protein FtsN